MTSSMKISKKLAIFVSVLGVLTAGCGSPAGSDKTSQKTNQAPSVVGNRSSQDASQESPSIQANSSGDAASVAEVTSFDPPSAEKAPTVQNEKKPEPKIQVQAEPATAKEVISVVNLLELPRLQEKNVLQSGSTFIYYSCKGTLLEADAFYKKLLESRGWKALPPLTPPTDQYIDLIFEKNGYCIQASLSTGSDRGELGIVLSSLGNVDMRSLPRLSNADPVEPSSRINVTYKTSSSIPDVADAVHKQLTEDGWQAWQPFQPSPVDVPHYRDLHYRKHACRLLIGIAKNPQNPADNTSVSYMSEYVIPFDIPMLNNSQTLKLDLSENRASFEMSKTRHDLVSFLQSSSQKFGWKLSQSDSFEAGDVHMLPIHVDSGAYLVARLVESGGKYSGSIEYFTSAPQKAEPSVEAVANANSTATDTKATAAADTTFDELQAQVNSAIQSELSKALSSLGSAASNNPKMNLAELQAKTEEIQAKLGASQATTEDDQPGQDQSSENPFDVAEDTSAPSAEIRAIKKSMGNLKYDGKSYQLSHVACYAIKEYGQPTKCILFSDSPIDVEKLKRTLLKEGRAVHGMHVSENAKNMVDFRVTEDSVSLNAQIGSLSMGISTTKIKADVSYFQGKMTGKIVTTEPIDVGEKLLEFAMTLSEPAIQVDWTKRNSPESMKLVADKSREYLVPEDCKNLSSEGSKYSKKIEAIIDEPLAAVQTFYVEELDKQGWKPVSEGDGGVNRNALSSGGIMRYQLKDQELALKLESKGPITTIKMQTRNAGAAKADAMLPPAGKALLVLGNMSDTNIRMSIAGKQYSVAPSMEAEPKNATKVVVDPGNVKIQVSVEKDGKKYDMEAKVVANSTWGVMFDTSFQEVLRLF